MKVWYWTVNETGVPVKYYEKRHEVCCPRMGEMVGRNEIAFGSRGEYDHYRRDVNIEIDHEETPVEFCPFCGAAIEAIEERNVNRKWVEREVMRTVGEYVYTDVDTGEVVDG